MGYFRDTFDLLRYFRDTFGILLGYFVDTFERLFGYFWDTFGILLGDLGELRTSSGLSQDYNRIFKFNSKSSALIALSLLYTLFVTSTLYLYTVLVHCICTLYL